MDIEDIWQNAIRRYFPQLTRYRSPDANERVYKEWLRRSLDYDRSYRNRAQMRRRLRALTKKSDRDVYLEVHWYNLKTRYPWLTETDKGYLWVGYVASNHELSDSELEARRLRNEARHRLTQNIGYDLEPIIQPWIDYKEAA